MYIEVKIVRRLKIPNLFFYWTVIVRGENHNHKIYNTMACYDRCSHCTNVMVIFKS